jgi:uncharacterized protein (DUF58 family)
MRNILLLVTQHSALSTFFMDFGEWYAQTTRAVDLRIRSRVQTIMQGVHPSTFRGRGDDFEFFQHHTLGEETARIDWKASERLQKGFLVRKLREERVLEVWIVVDLSASIFTGFSVETSKQRLLLDVLAVLGRSVIQQQDLLGIIGFDNRIRMVLSPFRSEKTFVNLLRTIWDFQPTPGETTALLPILQFFEANKGMGQQNKKRLVFLISDFETEEDWVPAVQRIHANHPIFPIFLEEPVPDSLLSSAGLLTYRDVESDEYGVVDARTWLSLLKDQRRREYERCLTHFEASGVRTFFISRETFSVDTLIDFLEEQRF